MKGQPVVCNTINGPVPSSPNPFSELLVTPSITCFTRDGVKWVLTPESNPKGFGISVEAVHPIVEQEERNPLTVVRSGYLRTDDANLMKLVDQNIETESRIKGLVLLTDVVSLQNVTPDATQVHASTAGRNRGLHTYVFTVKDGNVFQVRARNPLNGCEADFTFICQSGQILPYEKRSRHSSDNDRPFGDPGGSVLAPTKPVPPSLSPGREEPRLKD